MKLKEYNITNSTSKNYLAILRFLNIAECAEDFNEEDLENLKNDTILEVLEIALCIYKVSYPKDLSLANLVSVIREYIENENAFEKLKVARSVAASSRHIAYELSEDAKYRGLQDRNKLCSAYYAITAIVCAADYLGFKKSGLKICSSQLQPANFSTVVTCTKDAFVTLCR